MNRKIGGLSAPFPYTSLGNSDSSVQAAKWPL